MLPARFLPASLAVAAALLAGGAGAAGAEETGADRYEMIIAPPRRDSGGAVPGAEAPAAAEAASPPAAPAAPATDAAAPSQGPPRTLQVGAFRQRSSAEHLVESLGSDFGEVKIAEISSGGEPLYRVNVGRLPRGPALDALKKKLAAAGYPSFEVAAPADAPR